MEDWARKNNAFGGKETPEAGELFPGDSLVLVDGGEDRPPSVPHEQELGEKLGKMLDKYKDGMKRSLLENRKKLIMEANAHPGPTHHELGEGSRKRQEQTKQLCDEQDQVETSRVAESSAEPQVRRAESADVVSQATKLETTQARDCRK